MKDASNLIKVISDLIEVVGPILIGLITAYFNNKKNDRDYIKEENDRLNNENKELRKENASLRKELNDDD